MKKSVNKLAVAVSLAAAVMMMASGCGSSSTTTTTAAATTAAETTAAETTKAETAETTTAAETTAEAADAGPMEINTDNVTLGEQYLGEDGVYAMNLPEGWAFDHEDQDNKITYFKNGSQTMTITHSGADKSADVVVPADEKAFADSITSTEALKDYKVTYFANQAEPNNKGFEAVIATDEKANDTVYGVYRTTMVPGADAFEMFASLNKDATPEDINAVMAAFESFEIN